MSTPRPRARRPLRARTAAAAGGVVLRSAERGREVLLVGRTSDRSWVFPKGTPSDGETREETALREVREETGLSVKIIRPLGDMEYWFAAGGERVHKLVTFYLMEATGGDLSQHDHEYDLVRWVSVSEARQLLSFDTYRDVLDRAIRPEEAAS